MRTQPSSATELSSVEAGFELVAALASRDFPRLAATLAPDVRLRALIPPGPVEASGDGAAAKFSAWFGDAEELQLVRSERETIADRLHVSYRLRVKRPDDGWKVVEQHLICALEGGRISALDLLCTGFRPEAV
jgi:SnoaL-like domain